MNDTDSEVPVPRGELSLKLVSTYNNANGFGDIYGGWVVSQMDVAGNHYAAKIAHGRVATVGIGKMAFLLPVTVGSTLSFYTEVITIGRSSIKMNVEVWVCYPAENELRKVTEAGITFVAITKKGNTRAISQP